MGRLYMIVIVMMSEYRYVVIHKHRYIINFCFDAWHMRNIISHPLHFCIFSTISSVSSSTMYTENNDSSTNNDDTTMDTQISIAEKIKLRRAKHSTSSTVTDAASSSSNKRKSIDDYEKSDAGRG